jgi:hypothetical protein
MNKTLAIGMVLATLTAAAPAAAATYSSADHGGAGLLVSTLERTRVGNAAQHVPHQGIDLRDLLGVTSVALGTAIDGSVQNFCAAMQTDCSGVGFAVVTSLAPLEGIDFMTASDFFATYLVKNRSMAAAARVPEPANWALWIAGFGALGMMQRRRVMRMA